MFENLFNFFKSNTNKIKNFFSGKTKTYLLGDGQELNLGGNVEKRPVYSLFANFGNKLVKYTEKSKQKAYQSKINNEPLEYSTSLTEVKKTKTIKSTGLLSQYYQRLNAPPSIIPEPVLAQASATPATALNIDLIKTPVKQTRYTSTSKIPMFKANENIDLSQREGSISSSIIKHHHRSLAAITAFRGSITPNLTIDKTILEITETSNDKEKL